MVPISLNLLLSLSQAELLTQQAAAAPRQRCQLLAPYPCTPTIYLLATADLAHTPTVQG